MGVPIWLVLVGLSGERPGSLLIHLSEPNVRVCVGDQEFEAESTTIGPIEVTPGEHRVRVIRDHVTLYEYPIVVQNGERREVSAAWMSCELWRLGASSWPTIRSNGWKAKCAE